MNILPPGCKTNDCTGIAPDAESYSLQDALYFNGTPVTVVITCPPGATSCTPGEPVVVTYPPDTFVFPDVPPPTPGQPIYLSMMGCQSTVSITLPPTATQAEIQAAVNEIIAQVAQQQAECDYSPPGFPPGASLSLSSLSQTNACLASTYSGFITATANPASYPVSFNVTGGSLPSGLVMSSNGVSATITGIPTTAGSVTFTITAVATNGAQKVQAFTIVVAGITTATPLTDAIVDEVYSVTLTTSGMASPLLWGIATGSLPAGLLLNSSTGEISGVPTTVGSSSFSVFVQNNTQQCFKTFSLVVESTPVVTCEALSETVETIFSTNGNLTVSIGESGITFNEPGPGGDFSDWVGVSAYSGVAVNCNFTMNIASNPDACIFNLLIYLYEDGVGPPPESIVLEVANFTSSQDVDFTIPAMPSGSFNRFTILFLVRPDIGSVAPVYTGSITCS